MLIERIWRISSLVALGCHNSEESCLMAEVQQGGLPKIIIVFAQKQLLSFNPCNSLASLNPRTKSWILTNRRRTHPTRICLRFVFMTFEDEHGSVAPMRLGGIVYQGATQLPSIPKFPAEHNTDTTVVPGMVGCARGRCDRMMRTALSRYEFCSPRR
jgi:hypothetical protein